jgi:hypothetical protein
MGCGTAVTYMHIKDVMHVLFQHENMLTIPYCLLRLWDWNNIMLSTREHTDMWTVVGIWREGRYFEHFGVTAL